MTALNLILRTDRACILTDGLVSHPDGRSAGFLYNKALPLPFQNAALAVRGPGGYLPILYAFLNHLPSFDAVVEKLPELAPMAREGYLRPSILAGTCPPEGWPVDVALAGWHDGADWPDAYFMTSLARGGHAAWTMEAQHVLVSPPTRLPLDVVTDASCFDVERDGARLVRSQRGPYPGESTIGGFAELTSVYRDRIETKILERWPEDVTVRVAA